MKKIFILFILLTNICAFGQSSVLIEPNSNNGILSKNATTISSDPGTVALPASGIGTRLMWIPSKSAFRVGTVDGNQWDANNVGTWSFASGQNNKASGEGSFATGYSTYATGICSIALGYYSGSEGTASTALGRSYAIGSYSTSMGALAIASGNYSTAIGHSTEATGESSLAVGYATTAQAKSSVALGYFNIISGTKDNDIATDPVFIVGNGTPSNYNNALTLLKNANLGVNTATPQYPLVFKDALGDKISLYNGNTTNTSPHYGMGIQSAKFQIFTPTNVDDVVIGYGRSAAFTENIRFKGNGNVGIGTSTPNAPLQFASTLANRKIVMYENANNDHQYVGFGVNGNALRYQIDVPLGSHIFYAAANASSSTELMRVNSTGLGIGVSPAEKLHVAGNIRASSLAGTGVRNVKADANGNLTTTAAQTKYYSASNLSFVLDSFDGTSNANYFDGMAYVTSGTDKLKCPLVLPHGAVVSNIKIYYSDNSAGNDLTFSLDRTSFPNAGGTYGSVSSSGSSASVLSTDISVNFTVDNQNNTYYVAVAPKTGGSVWINAITLCVRSVVVTYSE